jgi:hypothetical protein
VAASVSEWIASLQTRNQRKGRGMETKEFEKIPLSPFLCPKAKLARRRRFSEVVAKMGCSSICGELNLWEEWIFGHRLRIPRAA